MRFISLEEVKKRLPAVWAPRATEALDAVKRCLADDEFRSKEVNARDHMWQQLKSVLAEVSDGKCWYCESKEVRSDNTVDHFRPKAKVVERPDHKGYWWLAFDWSNYRLSCTFCNSHRKDQKGGTVGGKHDHFPLLQEENRAHGPDDDVSREQPELLDPTNPGDPGLLWFEANGAAVSKYPVDKFPMLHQRATRSILLYHLNHVAITESRQELCNYISRLVRDGEVYFERYSQGDKVAKQAFESAIETLSKMVEKGAEYSSTARAMLLGQRDRIWIEALLSTI